MPETYQSGLVSVMMPAYNAAAYIAGAIESVVAQSYALWELIIVDDGSTDATTQEVARFGDPRIRLVRQPNGGEASARNRALALACGEWIAFLDADDQFLPDHLKLCVEHLIRHREVDAVYTDGLYIDPAGHPLERLSSRRRGPFAGLIFEQFVRASDVLGPPICAMIRRSVIYAHDLTFDTRIVIGPDWDFFTRLAQFAPFGYIDEVTCLYRLHASSISSSTSQARRRHSLAICRTKAIQLPAFDGISLEARSYAFYDLLVNLLPGHPDQQAAAIEWPQFQALPETERARLLRLMANAAVLEGVDNQTILDWYRRSHRLAPRDPRSLLFSVLFRVSPPLCEALLRGRDGWRQKQARAKLS
jgi:glycosyltransferase involved in cell wall biosynthesis